MQRNLEKNHNQNKVKADPESENDDEQPNVGNMGMFACFEQVSQKNNQI